MKNKIDQYIRQCKRSLDKDIRNELKIIKHKQKINNKLKRIKKQLNSDPGKIKTAFIFDNIIKFFKSILPNIKKQLPVIINKLSAGIKNISKIKAFLKNAKHIFKRILRALLYREQTIFGLSCFIFLFLNITIVNIDPYSFFDKEDKSATGYHVFIDNIEVGLIDTKNTFYNIINELDEEYSWFEYDAELEKLITFTANLDDYTAHSSMELENQLIDFLNEYKKSWSIFVEGNKIVTLRTSEQAELVLGQIKEYFMPAPKEEETIENISLDFVESIQIRLSFSKKENIYSPEEAFNYLLKGTTEDEIYKITQGDTVWDLAIKYDIPVSDIQKANPDKNLSAVYIGDLLNLTVPKPYLHIDVKFNHTYKENIPFYTRIIRDDTLYRTDYKVEQRGIYGEKLVYSLEIYQNDQKINIEILSEQVLFQPQTKIVRIGTLRTPDDVLISSFILPPDTGLITSRFGMRSGKLHIGIDLAIAAGTPLLSFRSGTVIFTGRKSGYGKLVIVQHSNDIVTYYAHMSEIQVTVGQYVSKRQQIGLSGNTGYSTGHHVHFEIRVNGKVTDPLAYISQPVYTASYEEEPSDLPPEEANSENQQLGIGPMEE